MQQYLKRKEKAQIHPFFCSVRALASTQASSNWKVILAGKLFHLLTDGRFRLFYKLRRRLDAHHREGPKTEGGRVLITPSHGNHLGRFQMAHITSQHTPLKR